MDITVSITRDSDGKTGFRFNITDLSIIQVTSADLGLQVGDTIVAVNGVPVRSRDEYYHEAKGVPRFELTVHRISVAQAMVLPGNVKVGQRIISLIDFEGKTGSLQKGDVGIVRGHSSTRQGQVNVDFPGFKNLDVLPNQFHIEAFKVGEKVEAKDNFGGWYPATVQGFAQNGDIEVAWADDSGTTSLNTPEGGIRKKAKRRFQGGERVKILSGDDSGMCGVITLAGCDNDYWVEFEGGCNALYESDNLQVQGKTGLRWVPKPSSADVAGQTCEGQEQIDAREDAQPALLSPRAEEIVQQPALLSPRAEEVVQRCAALAATAGGKNPEKCVRFTRKKLYIKGLVSTEDFRNVSDQNWLSCGLPLSLLQAVREALPPIHAIQN
jgi:hypothetical protein